MSYGLINRLESSMEAKRHLKEWKWTLLIMLGYIRYALTTETAIVITESPNKLYKVTMAGSSPSVQHIIDLRSAASGIVYNDNTDEIVWGEGSHIKKMSANGSLYSINSGIRAGLTVQDVAVDNMTGDIIFVGGDKLYSMTTDGQISFLHSEFLNIQSVTVDNINRLIYYSRYANLGGIHYRTINGSSGGWKDFTMPCKWITYRDGTFYWIDSGNIKGGALTDGSDYDIVYSGVTVNHFTVLGNSIYVISSDRLESKVFLVVFGPFSTLIATVQCPRDIMNGQLSDSCSLDVGKVCASFNCNYGYEDIGSISINCTAAGAWDADISIICTASQCPRHILNGQLSDSCLLDVGEVCASFNCNYGYENMNSLSISCTAAETWDADSPIICTEISAVPEQDNYAIIVIVPIVATVVIVAVCIIVLLSKSRKPVSQPSKVEYIPNSLQSQMEEDDYINADITSERGGDVDVQQSEIYNNDSVYSEIHEDHIYLTVIP